MLASSAIPHLWAMVSIVLTSSTNNDRQRVQYSSRKDWGISIYSPWSISTCDSVSMLRGERPQLMTTDKLWFTLFGGVFSDKQVTGVWVAVNEPSMTSVWTLDYWKVELTPMRMS